MGNWIDRGTIFSLEFEAICRLKGRSQWKGRLRKCKGEVMFMEQGVGADGKEWSASSGEGSKRKELELAFVGCTLLDVM